MLVPEEYWAMHFVFNPPWSYCSGVSLAHYEQNHGELPKNSHPTSMRKPSDYPDEAKRLTALEAAK